MVVSVGKVTAYIAPQHVSLLSGYLTPATVIT